MLVEKLKMIAAGEEIPIDVLLDAKQERIDMSSVGLVLGWLGKAGYEAHSSEWGEPVIYSSFRIWRKGDALADMKEGRGKSLTEALVAALLALPTGDER